MRFTVVGATLHCHRLKQKIFYVLAKSQNSQSEQISYEVGLWTNDISLWAELHRITRQSTQNINFSVLVEKQNEARQKQRDCRLMKFHCGWSYTELHNKLQLNHFLWLRLRTYCNTFGARIFVLSSSPSTKNN